MHDNYFLNLINIDDSIYKYVLNLIIICIDITINLIHIYILNHQY
jgi:hypothetical protein